MNAMTETTFQDKKIILIGTAHVSKASAQQVREAIEQTNPDSICIELDAQRYQTLKNPDKWSNTDITKIIKEKKVGYLLANVILSSYQKRVAQKLETKSGAEMMAGIELSEKNNKNLVLADRDIQTTFTRCWRKVSFGQKCKLLTTIFMSLFDDSEITEEDLKQLQEKELLDSAIQEITKEFPTIREVIIDERNQYLAEKIKTADGKTILAICGAAHIPGILEELQKDHDLEALVQIPPKKTSSKIVGWIIPAAIMLMILFTFNQNASIGLAQIQSWILWNGSLSALGVLLAFGHPASILTAFLAAPITSLNPLLAAGWFAGLVEAHFRKPTVHDFETMSDDVNSFKGLWKNRVTHILMVVVLANLFSTLGTIVGGVDIIQSFLRIFS